MPRSVVWTVYGLLVLIWSSTWVSIKIGLEDLPPLFGAGLRFGLAGLLLLAGARLAKRSLRTDPVLAATLAVLPFGTTYGLVYWAEQHIPSGLTAVLFGVLPLYTALLAASLLPDEPLRARLVAGIGVAIAGLALAFNESLELGDDHLAGIAALAAVLSPFPSAIGSMAIKRRGAMLDALVLNGWAMLAAGIVFLVVSAPAEAWGDAALSAASVGSIAYLAVFGTAFTFVGLTLLLREMTAVATSFISVLIPFGALGFGALLEDEIVTGTALAGAGLVAAGIAVAQWPRRRIAPAPPG
ncbi:MAG TPA: EamA family transporter [Solirubrobacteraceae bacterium]